MPDFFQDWLWPWLLKASWQAGVIVLLVWVAQCLIGRRGRPSWRHALWLLVVARLVLPVTIPSPVSLFNVINVSAGTARAAAAGAVPGTAQTRPLLPVSNAVGGGAQPRIRRTSIWMWLWSAGMMVMAAGLGANHYRLHRSVTRRRPLIDGAVLNLLEDCKQRMGVRTPITVVETAEVDGPCLFGVLRPRLLLPPGFTRSFSHEELRHVFLHELGHVKRHDIPMGWLMAWLQVLHWFNPLVWLAFSRMRLDRELACDAVALSYAEDHDCKPYGRTMVKLLEGFSGTLRAPSLAGVAEDKQQMKERILMIAQFHKPKCSFAAAAGLLIGLGLLTLTDAQTGNNPAGNGPTKAGAAPKVIATSPKIGATDVDPALKEITVTFDQDMEEGFSWIGSGPSYPKLAPGTTYHWLDKRTCVVPVQLHPGHFYRVSINSANYNQFRGENGVSVTPLVITFRTSGTPLSLEAPEIVRLEPPNGATDISPDITELRVTFDVPMQGGYSWVNPPPSPNGKKVYWTKDQKTCVFPVNLQPGTEYHLSLNSGSFTNFCSEDGVLLKPAGYSFRTSDRP